MPTVLTILIVEDNVAHERLTRYILKRQNIPANYEVVQDGQEALDYLQRRGRYAEPASSPRPDLILLDLNLPKRDGREVLKLIKQDAGLRDIPVIVVSTSDRLEDVTYSYQTGAAAYISKSAGFDLLVTQLGDVLRFVHAKQEPGTQPPL